MILQSVHLEPEQKELLCKLVEAERNLPADKREKFKWVSVGNASVVYHKGLAERSISVTPMDVEVLARQGLIDAQTAVFYVTPEGHEYYRWMKQSEAEPIQAVENEIRRFLVSGELKANYSIAVEKWLQAETLLWASDSQDQYTTIGHLCRESIQHFASALVEQHRPPCVDTNTDHTINRVKAVLSLSRAAKGEREQTFLDALVEYWQAVNGLIQRQEHGTQKQGEQLTWEDGRRIVFHTLIVMYEVHKAIPRQK